MNQKVVDSEVKKIVDDLDQLRPSHDVPQQLYHYTEQKRLMGILDSKRLWATDITYLNDSMELRYGFEIISSVIGSKIAEGYDELKSFLEDVKLYVNLNSASTTAYVTCFCEDGNLLSQWRAYANHGAGYSIGIEAKALVGIEYEGPGRLITETLLRKVLYDRATQEQLVKNTIDRFSSLFQDALKTTQAETPSINLVANPLSRQLWH